MPAKKWRLSQARTLQMKNHNVDAIANPKAAGIAPQERMPGPMRVLYPADEQNFQAKVWVGGDSIDDAEYEDEKVKAVVGYLRSMDNRMTSTGTEYTTSTYQLQQWRNIDYSKPPANYDEKWQLIPLTLDKTSTLTFNLRAPRSVDAPTTFTFYIDTDKFASGTYKYKVISFEKLETKLHLMSKKDNIPASPPYEHIEDQLVVQDIWQNIGYCEEEGYNDSPIVSEGTFPADSGEQSISIGPMSYEDPDPPSPPPPEPKIFTMTDFVICIKPDS